jgi:hypothetical protein
MKTMSRQLRLGRLFYTVYYYPLGLIRRSIREGGPINQFITRQGRMAMFRAALQLPSLNVADTSSQRSFDVHVLTGRRFWYQTAFCVRSLIFHARPVQVRPIFYDDGTLGEYRDTLSPIFPDHRFVSKAQARERLETHLPRNRYPFLHDRWEKYPNIRKLIDPHLGLSGWKLVLDSDILFFRRPDFLLSWMANPAQPLHMIDMEESYGYSRVLLEKLSTNSVPKLLNVGLCGLRSESLDWDRIEWWIRELITAAGTHYYLEQALIAMIVAGRKCAIAPAFDYITWPSVEESMTPTAVMHHYVSESKAGYFRHGWKSCLGRMSKPELAAIV